MGDQCLLWHSVRYNQATVLSLVAQGRLSVLLHLRFLLPRTSIELDPCSISRKFSQLENRLFRSISANWEEAILEL